MSTQTGQTGGKASKGQKQKKEGSKSAAKRSPEPVPTDPLVFSIDAMPAVPALRHALVSWGRGQGQQADLDTALLARELCEKRCHSCGETSDSSLALGTPWHEVKLCSCLEAESPGQGVYAQQMRHFGQARVQGAPTPATNEAGNHFDEFKKKYGQIRLRQSHYKEFLPDWRNRIPELMELARERRISPDEVIYANQCSCGTDFSVTARMIVRSVNRHGSHMEMTKCKQCRDALLASLVPEGDEDNTESQMTVPRNKRRNKPRALPDASSETSSLVASTNENNPLATFGEVLEPALKQLRQEAS